MLGGFDIFTEEGHRVERFLVEVLVGLTGAWALSLEHLGHLVDSDLAQYLHLTGSHIDSAVLHFVLTCDQDVVVLCQLRVPDSLLDVAASSVQFCDIAQLVEVEVDRLAVFHRLLTDRANDQLSG